VNEDLKGLFVGTVMDTIDKTCMGRLRVWIPELSKLDANDEHGWITVRYASPFYGVTNLDSGSADSPDSSNTSQSYGMWFVPPDVGVQVLVMFASAQGYWFACVPNQLMNHMIPGIAQRGATAPDAPNMDPVTEYNKLAVQNFTSQSAIFADTAKAPQHSYQAAILSNQGLTHDEARGPSMSSARRETPSGAFGISTPGQILGRISNVPADRRFFAVKARAGGHQFVMDDGDALGQSQCIRIRSSGGGMVLINDTIGSVYVINQSGSAWVEMTANGRIDVYGQGSVNVHAQKDLNLTADNNINMLATKSLNIVAATINTEAVEQRHYGKAKFYARSPDTMIESDSLTLIAKTNAGGGATTSQFGTGLTVQADNGSMQFSKGFDTLAGDNITFQTTKNFQAHAVGTLTLKSDGKVELDAGSGIYEAAKQGSGTIAKLSSDIDADMSAGPYSKNPTGWDPKKNWFEGDSTAIPLLKKDPRTSAVVEIPKPFNSGVQQSHAPITPQHEPWTDHDVNSSTSVPQTPPGLSQGDAMFASGAGVAFPDDTTGITAGSIGFALSESLATFLADMAFDFASFREDYAATVSRGRYSEMPDSSPMINPNGFIGRYQLGMSTLKDLGVTKAKSQDKDTVLSDGSWTPATTEILSPAFGNKAILSPPGTPQLGPASSSGFLLDTALQDKCFIASVYANYLALKNVGIIGDLTTNQEKAGWIKTSLLMGVGNPGSFSKLAPSMQISAQQATSLTASLDGTGGGAIGLYTWWKILKRDPTLHPSHDAAGGTTYKYYAQGSKTQ